MRLLKKIGSSALLSSIIIGTSWALATPIIAERAASEPGLDPRSDMDNNSHLVKRQSNLNVKYCEHIEWGAPCTLHFGALNTCHNLETSMRNKISSYENRDASRTCCRWYDNLNCAGSYTEVVSDNNLHDAGGVWHDRIESFKCVGRVQVPWTGVYVCNW
ncbi:hypothetical protein V8F06_013518 [Rhypophila decipiens]